MKESRNSQLRVAESGKREESADAEIFQEPLLKQQKMDNALDGLARYVFTTGYFPPGKDGKVSSTAGIGKKEFTLKLLHSLSWCSFFQPTSVHLFLNFEMTN